MGRKRMNTGAPLPKALACGMLEDEGRVLFLIRKDERGLERIEMPCVLVFSGRNPLAELSGEFRKQTGIDAQIHDILIEGKYNAGSRKRKQLVPVLVFEVTAKSMRADPSSEFSGFKWLGIKQAERMKHSRKAEWVKGLSLAYSK